MSGKADLRHVLDEGVNRRIITGDQARQLSAIELPKADRQGQTIRIASWIGAALVAVGIITFVASNWTNIPASLRTVLLVIVTGAAIFGAWRLIDSNHPITGHGLLAIGGVGIGGTIFQVANWAQLPANNPSLLALWFIALAPLAYAFRSVTVLLQAVILLPIWIVLLLGQSRDAGEYGAMMVFALTALGLAGLAFIHSRKQFPGFKSVFAAAGVGGTLLVGFVATFTARFFDETDGYALDWPLTIWAIIAGLAFVASAGFVATRKPLEKWNLAALGILAAIALVAITGQGILLPNLLYPAFLLGLIFVAIQGRNESLVNLGLLFFVIELIGRYVDFLFDEMDPSLFFIVGGVLLLLAGYGAEKLRRRLLAEDSQ